MKLVRVAGAALNQTPLDWDGNSRNIVDALDQARGLGASIVCLPELCITGYGCEDAFLSPGVHATALGLLSELLPSTRGLIATLGLPIFHGKALYNTVCLAVDGKAAGLVAKQFLPGDGVHYEPRWFKPWPKDRVAQIDLGDEEIPLGDLFFDCGGVRIGLEICEDAWVANRPGSELALEGVDVILNPSASHFAFGKREVRKRYVTDSSRAFGVTYVYSNLLGNEAGRVIYGGGVLIAHGGELVASGPRMSFDDKAIACAVVDLSKTRMEQAKSGSFQPRLNPHPVESEFSFPVLTPEPAAPAAPSWEDSADLKEEEFTRAVALGLFDYLRKSGSKGFVVSTSGGVDSSAVACLVAKMVQLAVAELGMDSFRKRLAHIQALQDVSSSQEAVGALLLCLYQSTRNSSDTTRNAARQVARAIGAQFISLDVDPLVEEYTGLVSGAVGRELSWDLDDVALQNIQARVRGPGAWMLANLRGSLLLTTSNRSEAAVGYSTMDGDTCGGLAPVGGIDKDFLRHWLRWLESEIPELAAVNAQEPTAELRPLEQHQTDETDLMPYAILDAIEDAAIRDRYSPLEVFLSLRVQFPQHPDRDLCGFVERFFTLWYRNQWKRERYAPSFHLDDKSLDPKTWCRFPILSGGFERELKELRAYVDQRWPVETESV